MQKGDRIEVIRRSRQDHGQEGTVVEVNDSPEKWAIVIIGGCRRAIYQDEIREKSPDVPS